MLTPQQQKHPDYIRYVNGFDKGYLLAKELPKVADALAQSKSNDPWISGMRDGREQFLAEKMRDYQPKWLNPDHGAKSDFNEARAKDNDKVQDAKPAPKKDPDKDER